MHDSIKSDELGARLRRERERLGLSQVEFAQVGGVKRVTQYLYEHGDRSPDSDYLLRVHQIGVDVIWVMFGATDPETARHTAAAETLAERLRLVKALTDQIGRGRKALGLKKTDESTLTELLVETLLAPSPQTALDLIRSAAHRRS